MINEANLKEVLNKLGFRKNGKIYEKKYSHIADIMSVDFATKKLHYPNSIKGRERNNGFKAPENFVVFECIDRLLEKGYRPEHIELEKEWHLGHDAKGGRADICVADTNGDMLFIIECKTWGKEFNNALGNTKNDGAQLFSYWQQEQSCRWLVLYTSDYKDGKIEFKAPTINCSDDANIILLAKKDKSIKLYSDAHTTREKYEVWKESYSCQIHDDLIFSEDSVAYQIGLKPLLKKDLRDFTPDDKIVNRFEEILRHNNVSDKENAFNRLIALFICKLVDEITKNEDDEVEFQYKQGTDTYETLQDRLQRLHCEGMEKFMREKIYYVASDYPERLFSAYTGANRRKAIEDLKNTIRILKFYSNNDFAFKNVHNEELFYQNGKILVEMVQLFEKYRIVYPSKHQFLGDLFEQLLNKGFKQNEGQFFTPIPITRFIWDSLPIERMVRSERGTVYPKIIDYACGAGHFLTEAIETINCFVHSSESNDWARDHIYGIEKDYRLARVAKISLFMNGAGEGNIIFGDGLENAPDKGIEDGAFDILVANPPYSVKDFKQHLQLKNNSFTILNKIGLNGSEIEVLFVERIAQLLKPRGIAAVILPSSILSNDSASYTSAREQFLKNFYIRAIVALGSITFGATGTNTVVMFLEKFNEPPKQVDLVSDTVDAVFGGAELNDWKDKEVFEAYLEHIGLSEDVYRAFLSKTYSIAELNSIEYLRIYAEAFVDSADAKNLQKTKSYKNKSAEERAAAYLERFYAYAHSIEKEKMFYFSLVYRQKTVIVTAPAEKDEQKVFLGYGWSKRKGNEGIQIISPGGKLYDDCDRTAKGTIADVIRQSFNGEAPSVGDEQEKLVSVVNTADMLDFARPEFNKTIKTQATVSNKSEIKSKYALTDLLSFPADIQKGKSITKKDAVEGEYKVVAGGKDFAYMHNEFNRPENTITISASGANAGYVNLWREKIFASDCTTVRGETDLATSFIYYYLMCNQNVLFSLQKGAGQPHVYSSDIEKIQIPVPPTSVQKKIVKECEGIYKEYRSTRMNVESYRQKTEELFNELETIPDRKKLRLTLSDKKKFSVSIGKRVLNTELVPNGNIPVYSANVNEPFGYLDELLIKDFSVPSVLWGIDGDWMTAYMPENTEFYPTDHCGVLRCKSSEVNPRYLARILETEGRKMGFSRSYRASIDRIRGITFTVPDRTVQDAIISEILDFEAKINEAENALDTIIGKTADILKRYLQ